jgi:nucleotide-binding universal stress UspA family protein
MSVARFHYMRHIQNILVPMDGSPSAIAALWEAVGLAEDLGAGIEVLHVKGNDEFAIGSTTSERDVERAQSDRDMEEAIDQAKNLLGPRLSRRTDAGEPVRKILDVATADHADLIVMGTHGRVGRLHALVGSVAEGIVRNAPCPVLTVRRTGGEAESFGERLHRRPGIASH